MSVFIWRWSQRGPGLNILNIHHISHLHPRRWQCWHPNTGASAYYFLCATIWLCLFQFQPFFLFVPIFAHYFSALRWSQYFVRHKEETPMSTGLQRIMEKWSRVHFLVDVLFINMVYGWSNLQYFFIDEILVHNIFRGSPSYPCCSSWLGGTKSDIGVRRSLESGPGSAGRVFKYQLAAARAPAAARACIHLNRRAVGGGGSWCADGVKTGIISPYSEPDCP